MATKTITINGHQVFVETRNTPVFKVGAGFLRTRIGTKREVVAMLPGALWHVTGASVKEAVEKIAAEKLAQA